MTRYLRTAFICILALLIVGLGGLARLPLGIKEHVLHPRLGDFIVFLFEKFIDLCFEEFSLGLLGGC